MHLPVPPGVQGQLLQWETLVAAVESAMSLSCASSTQKSNSDSHEESPVYPEHPQTQQKGPAWRNTARTASLPPPTGS